ncbi:MAG: peptide-methionine (R)-S-oxide reductase MsrB [Xanthomonadales bacterium]|nr:peptide-methionine (R)-S-oxide reductase MsrB [Xanthomonadales bacterium]
MNRRTLLQHLATLAILPLLPACSRAAEQASAGKTGAALALGKPREEWRGVVSAPAYAVLFEEDTEPSASSPLNNEHREGTFVCAACRLPIFNSADKFESGTGWPSFTQPIAGHVETKRDFKLVWPRTEYHCVRCGGHQGHIFNDGPKPRGERWCNNGLALEFIPSGQPLPELRS